MKKSMIISLLLFCCQLVSAANLTVKDWAQIEREAQGQTVYFYAWGGSPQINTYLVKMAQQIKAQFGVTLKQVKVADISDTTMQLLTENSVGKVDHGSVDLIWINGQNFAVLKENDLLYGPLHHQLPNWALLDKNLPLMTDFSLPTEGYEVPWGVGQLVFIHDAQTLAQPPKSFAQLLTYAKHHPYTISYPRPPEFHGSSFLKAALIELTDNNSALYQPVDTETFAKITAPLWSYLDELHPVAWRKGEQFPQSSAEMIQLLDNGELDLAITFNPNDAQVAINQGQLVETAKTYAFSMGALSNLHFLAIPKNSSAKEGALVVINALLSREAQREKADVTVWGDPSVLAVDVLTDSSNQQINQGFDRFPSLPELDPSWQDALNKAWKQRYGH